MIKALGIAIYLVSLLLHYKWGVNGVAFWVALYHCLQNLGLACICSDAIISKSKYASIYVVGVVYFSSAFVFYLYAVLTNQLIYFSNSGEAANVLTLLLVIALLVTFFERYVRRGKQ